MEAHPRAALLTHQLQAAREAEAGFKPRHPPLSASLSAAKQPPAPRAAADPAASIAAYRPDGDGHTPPLRAAAGPAEGGPDTVGREIEAAIARSVSDMFRTPGAPNAHAPAAARRARAAAAAPQARQATPAPAPSPAFMTSKRVNMHCELDDPGSDVPFARGAYRRGPRRGWLAAMLSCFLPPPPPASPPTRTPGPRASSAKPAPPTLQLPAAMAPLRQSLRPGDFAAAMAAAGGEGALDADEAALMRRSVARSLAAAAAADPPTPRFGGQPSSPAVGREATVLAERDYGLEAELSFESMTAEPSQEGLATPEPAWRRGALPLAPPLAPSLAPPLATAAAEEAAAAAAAAAAQQQLRRQRAQQCVAEAFPGARALGVTAPPQAAQPALRRPAAPLPARPAERRAAPEARPSLPPPRPQHVEHAPAVLQTRVAMSSLLQTGSDAARPQAPPRQEPRQPPPRRADHPPPAAEALPRRRTAPLVPPVPPPQQRQQRPAAPIARPAAASGGGSAPASPLKRPRLPLPQQPQAQKRSFPERGERPAIASRASSPLRRPGVEPRMNRAAAARSEATRRLLLQRRKSQAAHLAALPPASRLPEARATRLDSPAKRRAAPAAAPPPRLRPAQPLAPAAQRPPPPRARQEEEQTESQRYAQLLARLELGLPLGEGQAGGGEGGAEPTRPAARRASGGLSSSRDASDGVNGDAGSTPRRLSTHRGTARPSSAPASPAPAAGAAARGGQAAGRLHNSGGSLQNQLFTLGDNLTLEELAGLRFSLHQAPLES